MSYSLKLVQGDCVIIKDPISGQWLDGHIIDSCNELSRSSKKRHNWLSVRTAKGHYHVNLLGDYEFKKGGSYNLMVIRQVEPIKPK